MKKFLASALLLASVSVPAFAQDAVPFSGPYIGGVVGLDHVDFDANTHDSALLYGGVIGYDINVNGAVFGVEGEYADSDVNEGAFDIRTDRDLYAGIRIGGEITPNVLAYAKGGYTNARFEDSAGDGVKLDGYRLGAGLETTVQGFIARAEYRYSSYETVGTIKPERHQAALILGYRF